MTAAGRASRTSVALEDGTSSPGPAGSRARRGQQRSLRQLAYERLEEMIVTQELEAGIRVTELKLCEMTGLGRTPIREALQRLAREGLVEIRPRSGIEISRMSVQRQFELLEVRSVMQDLLVRCAAERAQPAQRTRMRQLAREIVTAAARDDGKAYFRLSRDVHSALCEAARNQFLDSMMTNLYGLSRQFGYIHYRRAGDLNRAARLHAQVLEAVAAGDARAARDASREMMSYLVEFTQRSVLLTPLDD